MVLELYLIQAVFLAVLGIFIYKSTRTKPESYIKDDWFGNYHVIYNKNIHPIVDPDFKRIKPGVLYLKDVSVPDITVSVWDPAATIKYQGPTRTAVYTELDVPKKEKGFRAWLKRPIQ